MSFQFGKDYEFKDANKFLEDVFSDNVDLIDKGKIEYFNLPCSFDIETTSFILGVDEKGEPIKASTMYIWQFGINGRTIYGRTWKEYKIFIHLLIEYCDLSNRARRLVVYVHNLGYEFQFLRKHFEWYNVFAMKQRRPVYAVSDGIEYRCSYFLSNYSLEYIGNAILNKYKVKKMVGDLDYSLIRNSKTLLTPEEMEYCLNDVKIVMAYIQEKIEDDGDITKIPLTNTGYVRNYCRDYVFYQDIPESEPQRRKSAFLDYKALMKSLEITSKQEYEQLERAFMGGFTHASSLYSGIELDDVGSADETSAYPFTMCAQYYPMTKCKDIGNVENKEYFKHLLSKYCCLFDIKLVNVKPKVEFENVLSVSRCHFPKGSTYSANNGRVICASQLVTTLTELDYETIEKFYTWEEMQVINMKIYRRGYLPKQLIEAILGLYENKTLLKGVTGKETEYLNSKGMLNASYGMMVTAIIRDEFEYDNDWLRIDSDTTSQLAEYNRSYNRFLFYGWGVWVTAHARHNLFSAIYEFGNDYVYSDTDSIKGINFENHMDYFNKYNINVKRQLVAMCAHYNIPFSKCQPETIKGEKKLIGVWDFESGYNRFKTVGAKRYMYLDRKNKLDMTVSGVNKKFAIPFLLEDNNNNIDLIFKKFDDGLFIPKGHTGKNTLTYIDDEVSCTLVDYQGNAAHVYERSGIHMEPQSYFMSLTADYINFLKGVQTHEY